MNVGCLNRFAEWILLKKKYSGGRKNVQFFGLQIFRVTSRKCSQYYFLANFCTAGWRLLKRPTAVWQENISFAKMMLMAENFRSFSTNLWKVLFGSTNS